MIVTALIENRPDKTHPQLAAEWGLSLHIAFNGNTILFDMGSSGSFARNAQHLSLNIAVVNVAVLSHHHFDHGNGLRRFFELNSAAKVMLGEVPDGGCFAGLAVFPRRYVGLDRTLIPEFKDRFIPINKPIQILPDVFVLPHIHGNYPRPAGNKRIYLKKDGDFKPDDFTHEIVMAIKQEGRLVIFTGYSHNGILNIVDTIVREIPGIPIKAVIGGFHLVALPPFNFMAESKRAIRQLAKQVLDYPIDMTYTGHCTGTQAFRVLQDVMGERIMDVHTGSVLEI